MSGFTACASERRQSIFDKDEKLLAQITNHHGKSVRCSLWGSDAVIADAEKWLKWFDDRKIDGPRIEVEEMRKTREQS